MLEIPRHADRLRVVRVGENGLRVYHDIKLRDVTEVRVNKRDNAKTREDENEPMCDVLLVHELQALYPNVCLAQAYTGVSGGTSNS